MNEGVDFGDQINFELGILGGFKIEVCVFYIRFYIILNIKSLNLFWISLVEKLTIENAILFTNIV